MPKIPSEVIAGAAAINLSNGIIAAIVGYPLLGITLITIGMFTMACLIAEAKRRG